MQSPEQIRESACLDSARSHIAAARQALRRRGSVLGATPSGAGPSGAGDGGAVRHTATSASWTISPPMRVESPSQRLDDGGERRHVQRSTARRVEYSLSAARSTSVTRSVARTTVRVENNVVVANHHQDDDESRGASRQSSRRGDSRGASGGAGDHRRHLLNFFPIRSSSSCPLVLRRERRLADEPVEGHYYFDAVHGHDDDGGGDDGHYRRGVLPLSRHHVPVPRRQPPTPTPFETTERLQHSAYVYPRVLAATRLVASGRTESARSSAATIERCGFGAVSRTIRRQGARSRSVIPTSSSVNGGVDSHDVSDDAVAVAPRRNERDEWMTLAAAVRRCTKERNAAKSARPAAALASATCADAAPAIAARVPVATPVVPSPARAIVEQQLQHPSASYIPAAAAASRIEITGAADYDSPRLASAQRRHVLRPLPPCPFALAAPPVAAVTTTQMPSASPRHHVSPVVTRAAGSPLGASASRKRSAPAAVAVAAPADTYDVSDADSLDDAAAEKYLASHGGRPLSRGAAGAGGGADSARAQLESSSSGTVLVGGTRLRPLPPRPHVSLY